LFGGHGTLPFLDNGMTSVPLSLGSAIRHVPKPVGRVPCLPNQPRGIIGFPPI
jgi:hypothetical protein